MDALTVGIAFTGIALHFFIVATTAWIASLRGRSPLFWATVAMISGPIALAVMLIWRTTVREPVGDRAGLTMGSVGEKRASER